MDIIQLPFEKEITIVLNNVKIKLVTFKTLEHGNIKFGVSAPRNITVNREEIQHALLKAQQIEDDRVS